MPFRLANLNDRAVLVANGGVYDVQRHSGAKEATVRLSQIDDRLTVEISDQGIGFEPDNVGSGHFGLRGISERVRLLNGTVAIDSARGRGTRIRVSLPIPSATADPPSPVANRAEDR